MYNQSQKFNNNRERIGCLNGSYLNSSGQLVLSNPFEPRMNYTYTSSASSLEFDKRLIESSKKNYYTAKSITGDVSLYTKEYLIPGVNVWYSSTGNIFLDQDYTSEISSMSSSTNFTTSFFIKKIGGTASEINFTRRWYWAPSLVVNLDTGVIVSGKSPDIIFQYYGNGWYRIGGYMCGQGVVSNKNVALVNRVNSTDDIEVIVTCNMCEEFDSTNTIKSGSNTYYWPSSWIPYECTRKEYVYGTENEVYPSCGRNSIATYFDSTGILQVAEPYELRPNYTYTAPTSTNTTGTWTQNGNLEETSIKNLATTLDSSLTEITTISKLCSYDKVYQTAKDTLIGPNGYVALDNTSYVASIFIHRPSSTATYLDIWWTGGSPDGTTYSITNDCLMNNGNTISNYTSSTWKIGCVTRGDWTRVSLFLPLSSASHGSQWTPLWCPRNGYVNWTCIMVELYQDSYAPSSWIPHGMTRKSDYDKIDYISNRSTTASAIDSAGNIVLFEPYELRPKNVCSVSSYVNYCNIESATISDSGVSFTTISTPSNFISGNFISVITNNEVGWHLVKIPTTTNGLCKLSFFINITSGIVFYVSCQNNVNYNFNIDSSGNITTTSSPKNLVLQKMNNDYWYIEFDIIVSQFQESIYIGDPNQNQTLKFNIGNIKLLKLYDEQNYQGILIENESYNYCSGGTPTTTTSCSISEITYQNQQAWLIESPDVDQWSEISFPHTNTTTTLECTGSVYVKLLEDGTIAINNGFTYNSSFTFSNGTAVWNNDGGGNCITAGCEYIGNGIWRIYQVRNDGFIMNGKSNIDLHNSSQTTHFPKCIVFCFQLESGKQMTSWIPYKQTRNAD